MSYHITFLRDKADPDIFFLFPFRQRKTGTARAMPVLILSIPMPDNSVTGYLPGKKGQKIGIRITEMTKETITRPRPAFT
jgi:hypothetical protein